VKRVLTTGAILAAMVMTSFVIAPQPVATATAGSPAPWSAPGSGAVAVDPAPVGAAAGSNAASPPAPGPAALPARPVAARLSKIPAAGKMIEISLATQTLTAWENGRAVRSFKVSTGRAGYRTPTGTFKVRAKGIKWWSRKWQVWMPYAMNFYGNYNLHSLPYSNPRKLIGASRLGRPDSHGCVRIGPDNARWLYGWTPKGTPVWIHEKSYRGP